METKNREVSFPIKTRIPKDSNVVVISSETLYKSLDLSKQFAPNGRIATVNEVIKLRTVRPQNQSDVWNTHATTSSTEYLGLDRNNNPVIVSLPDFGPLSDKELFDSVFYSNQTKGLLSRNVFFDIIDGKFGKCNILAFDEILKEDIHSYMTLPKAKESKLLMSRLSAYVDKTHKNDAIKYLDAHWRVSKDNIQRFFGTHCNPEVDEFEIISCNIDYYRMTFCTHDVSLGDSRSDWKHNQKWDPKKKNEVDFENNVFVNMVFLSHMQDKNPNYKSVSDIGLSNAPFLKSQLWAIYNEQSPYIDSKKKLPIYQEEGYKSPGALPNCFVNADQVEEKNIWQVHPFNHWHFAICEDVLIKGSEGTPKYLVTSLKKVGEKTISKKDVTTKEEAFKSSYWESDLVKISLDDIKEKGSDLQVNWNAYVIDGYSHDSKYEGELINYTHKYKIIYYQVSLDTDRMIPTEAEILASPRLLGRIV
jgi:hypothetical protein